jgi:hypothetical protein
MSNAPAAVQQDAPLATSAPTLQPLGPYASFDEAHASRMAAFAAGPEHAALWHKRFFATPLSHLPAASGFTPLVPPALWQA